MRETCPRCDAMSVQTVSLADDNAQLDQRLALRECQECGACWGERRRWYGIQEDIEIGAEVAVDV